MAASLINIASSHPFSFHKPFLQFRHESRPKLLSTTGHFAVRAATSRKSSGGRKVMSNVELRDEIKQFLYSVGLTEDHVPSMKELSLHGRNDLANIVRRRGYKLIGELLAVSKELQGDGLDGQKIQMEKQLAAADAKEALEGQDEKIDNLAELMCLSSGISSKENLSANSDVDSALPFDGNSLSNEDSSAILTLEERDSESEDSISRDIDSVTEESIREEDFGDYLRTMEITSHVSTSVSAETSENLVEVEEASSLGLVDSLGSSGGDMPSSADASLGDNYSSNPNSSSIVNVNDRDTSSEHYSNSSLEEKVAKFMENGYLEPVEGLINHIVDEEQGFINVEFTKNENKVDIPLETPIEMQPENLVRTLKENNNRDGQTMDADLDNAEMQLSKQESLAEISHLKQMLHQKELELSRLKELIEKEKFALSILQDKAEREISKARELILEKDAELLAAEESLSGLVEVEIEYSGEGEIVEVAGSFNGWEHRIKMDPEELSNTTEITPSRKYKHWSTTLWLFPGTYEIKFIIDGQWKIDPQKETMTKGTITNNILRVYQ